LVHFFQLEQNLVEIYVEQASAGDIQSQKPSEKLKSERFQLLCKSYQRENLLQHINNISKNF